VSKKGEKINEKTFPSEMSKAGGARAEKNLGDVADRGIHWYTPRNSSPTPRESLARRIKTFSQLFKQKAKARQKMTGKQVYG